MEKVGPSHTGFEQNTGVGASAENVQLVRRAAGVLWGDQQLADSYSNHKKGWQGGLANALGTDRVTLQKAIASVGPDVLHKLVAQNPAGKAPVVEAAVPTATFDVCTQTYCGTCGCDSVCCPNPYPSPHWDLQKPTPNVPSTLIKCAM